MIGRPPRDPWERFWEKVAVTPSCWLWRSSHSIHGYGLFYLTVSGVEKNLAAHRVAYSWLVGEIPEGLVIDHLCRVRDCVNPSHMECVTLAENTRRGINHNTEKTRCPAGHLYDSVNPNGSRRCKRCDAAASRRYRERQAERRAA